MILVIFFLSTALFAQGLPSQSVFDWNSDARIVGGSDAKVNDHTSLALIWWIDGEDAFTCGGTIITDRFILTAAHCMHGQNAKKMTIQVGSKKVTKSGTSYIGDMTIIHEKYNVKTNVFDIALLRVSKNIVMTKNVTKMSLSTSYTEAGPNATAVGWGRKSTNGKLAPWLQEVHLLTMSESDCQKAYKTNECVSDEGNAIGALHVCTYTKGSKGTCPGDSGGPLIGSDNKQIGIISFGGRECGGKCPDVYTRVSKHINWITTNSKL